MKGTLRKMASVILIMAMVITSVSLDGLQVSAATKKPTKITLNAKSKTLTVGKSFQLKVKSVKPTKASKAVTYKSSNKKVATVSSKGKITAKKAGTATITVTMKSGAKATCKVTVKNPTVKLQKTKASLKVGKSTTIQIKSTYPSNDTVKSYTSSNKKVAVVNAKGKVTAKKAGTAVITVKMKSGATAKFKVTVKK